MQFSHEFHFIFSPFKILLISRDCLTYAHWAAASGKSRVVGSDGRTDGSVCPPWQRRSMVDGTMEFISSVLKGTPIQPMYHNKKKAAKYTIFTILHTFFQKKFSNCLILIILLWAFHFWNLSVCFQIFYYYIYLDTLQWSLGPLTQVLKKIFNINPKS